MAARPRQADARARGEKKRGCRRVSILVGNGGAFPAGGDARRRRRHDRLRLARDDGARSTLLAPGKAEEAEDLFDPYLPLVRYEQQPAIGLAVRKYMLFKRGAIASAAIRKPGAETLGADIADIDRLIARQDKRSRNSPDGTRPEVIDTLSQISTATITTLLLKKGLRNVWMRGTQPLQPGPAAPGRAGLHAALRAGARGSRHAGILVVADLDPRRDRGDAGGLHRRRRRHGRHRRRHLRRHPLRAHGQARRRGADHRRRGARRRRRARHRPAGLVPGRRRAALGRRPDLRRLAASRSAAAASRCSRTTSSSSTTTARC